MSHLIKETKPIKNLFIISLFMLCSQTITAQDFSSNKLEKGPASLGGNYVIDHLQNLSGYQIRARIPICTHLWLNPIYQVVDPNGENENISTALQFDYDLFQVCNIVPYLSSSLKVNNWQYIDAPMEKAAEGDIPMPSIDLGIGFDIKVIDQLSIVLETKYDLVPASIQSNIGARYNFAKNKQQKKKRRK
jgi:hypothetical protein